MRADEREKHLPLKRTGILSIPTMLAFIRAQSAMVCGWTNTRARQTEFSVAGVKRVATMASGNLRDRIYTVDRI